jgi:hypothetical protein
MGHSGRMPLRPDEPRREATLPPLAWTALIIGGVLLVLLVAGIAIQIAILQDSREHIRAQDAKTAILLAKVRAAEPATSEAAQAGVPLLEAARPVVGKVSRAIGPLTRSGDQIAFAIRRLPALTQTTEALAALALPLMGDLRRADLTRAIADTDELIRQVRANDLVEVAAQAGRETPRLMQQLLEVQLTTLKVQRRSLKTQLASLDVQRQTLQHAESIDRKTGGSLPAAAP